VSSAKSRPHEVTLTDFRLIINEHLTVLDKDGKPIKGVFAAGDNAMPESGAIPATGQGQSCLVTANEWQMTKLITAQLPIRKLIGYRKR
jgi:hypothetical protein